LRKERQKAMIVVLTPLFISILGTLTVTSLGIRDPAFSLILVLISTTMAFFAAVAGEVSVETQLWVALFGAIMSVVGVVGTALLMIQGPSITITLILSALMIQIASYSVMTFIGVSLLEGSFKVKPG